MANLFLPIHEKLKYVRPKINAFVQFKLLSTDSLQSRIYFYSKISVYCNRNIFFETSVKIIESESEASLHGDSFPKESMSGTSSEIQFFLETPTSSTAPPIVDQIWRNLARSKRLGAVGPTS